MATKDLPDYMRGFDLVEDWGVTAVEAPPKQEAPVVDTKPMENACLLYTSPSPRDQA